MSYVPAGIFASLSQIEQSSIILVPVPLHYKRQKERGFNQAEMIARHISDLFHIDLQKILMRNRYTVPQASLGKQEREVNLKGAFSVCTNKTVDSEKIYVLIDDVSTTRSTLEECARALRKAGAQHVGGFVLARK